MHTFRVVRRLGDVDEVGLCGRAGHLTDGAAEVVVAGGTADQLRSRQVQRHGHLVDVDRVAAQLQRLLRLCNRPTRGAVTKPIPNQSPSQVKSSQGSAQQRTCALAAELTPFPWASTVTNGSAKAERQLSG